MTTTLYCPVPYSGVVSQGYTITQAGTPVPDNLVQAIISAAYTAGVMLTTSAGGTAIIQSGRSYSSGTGPPSGDSYPLGWEVEDSTGATFVKKGDGTWAAAQSGTFAPILTPPTSITYNGDGTVATQTIGGVATSYTYNTDGTVATETRAGVTRTYSYTSGNLTGVA